MTDATLIIRIGCLTWSQSFAENLFFRATAGNRTRRRQFTRRPAEIRKNQWTASSRSIALSRRVHVRVRPRRPGSITNIIPIWTRIWA